MIVLIGYRENGVDTCRGCVMGRTDSDFIKEIVEDEDAALIELDGYAKRFAKNSINELAYGSYEWHVFSSVLPEDMEDTTLEEYCELLSSKYNSYFSKQLTFHVEQHKNMLLRQEEEQRLKQIRENNEVEYKKYMELKRKFES